LCAVSEILVCDADFESGEGELDRVRELYRRLLAKAPVTKVWLSFAKFESGLGEVERARKIFEEAHEQLKSNPAWKEEV